MQKLLRISFNKFVFSITPILAWFLVGIIIDSKMSNVFLLTYPIQFIYQVLLSIFATGANINETKDHQKGAAFSGFVLGAVIGGIIFFLISCNLDLYISFMNMEYDIYKEFALFSVISLYISLVFGMLMEKLYFADKTKYANNLMVIFNMIYLITLVGTALLTHDKTLIVIMSLLSLTVFTFYSGIRTFKNFRFKLNVHLYKWFRYESYDALDSCLMFLIYLFGLSHSTGYGIQYIMAINYSSLITDAQWDSYDAVSTVAKIDISNRKFNLKKSVNNSYKLLAILLFSSFIMFVATIRFYEIDMVIFLIFLAAELYYFLAYPFIAVKACYLQIEWSPFVTTSNKITASIIRFLSTFLNTPFCLCIGQAVSCTYHLIGYGILYKRVGRNKKILRQKCKPAY